MRIIDTVKNLKSRIVIFIFVFCALILGFGCTQKGNPEQLEDYIRQSQDYYQRAVSAYKEIIAKGADLERPYLELGKLYYKHGEFEQAIGALKHCRDNEAQAFLAISYYRLGNFTDALEVFNKNPVAEDEYVYYHGLTCEKLNLFDDALVAYKKIKGAKFKTRAFERIDNIEKQANLARHIKDISPQTYRIINTAPAQEKYPQAGALILYCDEKIEITDQNTQVSNLHYIVKILNERGKENFSETHIDYDSTYEKIELEYARTIKPDGGVAEVGSRHIRDVSKYLEFPLYSNARAYIISFPEIVEGACLEYKLKIMRNQLINKKDFVLSYPVQAGEPIIAANFSLTLPKEKPLSIKILNDKYNDFGAALNPKVSHKDNCLIYQWEFRNIPQIIPESSMPPEVQVNPALLISTFNNWEDIYKWWSGLAKDKIRADTAIKEKVRQLIKKEGSNEAKIRAIYNFCAQKIRYVAVEYGQAGYEPHPAPDIFKNKYGDCKDQAILLVAMLREAGFSAWPVLIATKDYYDLNEEFPAVFFNHCIAAVSLKDKVVFMDPTAETCSFDDLPAGDQGRKVLVFREDRHKIEETPLYPSSHNLVTQELKIKVNSDETITGQRVVASHGIYDQAQRYWLLYTQPELIQEALKERIQGISIGSRLDKYNIQNLDNLNEPVILKYSFNGPEYFTVAGLLRIMPQLVDVDTSLVAKDKRKYAIEFSALDSKEVIFEIEIPDNFVIKYIPDSLLEDSPWLRFAVEYKLKNNTLYFRQQAELKKITVGETEYPEFKDFFERLAKKAKQRIVLERAK